MTWIGKRVPGGMRTVLLGLAFFAITSVTIGLTRFGGGLALVWLGTAVLVAALATLPRVQWAPILLSFAALSALATSLFGFGPHLALQLAVVNVFEGYVIARLLLAFRPQCDWLENVEGLVVLIAAGGLLGPALAAIPGGLVVALVNPGSWQSHAADWIAGHGLGTLLGFPIAYMAASGTLSNKFATVRLPVVLECFAHALIVGAVTAFVFLQTDMPLLFLPIVPLLFAAFRRGRVGASIGLLAVATVTAISLALGEGFDHPVLETLGDKVLYLQLYLAVLLLLALPVSVALKHNKLLFVAIEEKRALKGLIADHSDDALINLDGEGRIRFASPASERLSGQTELVGERLSVFFDPLDEAIVLGTLIRAGADPGLTCVLERAVLRNDEQIWLEARMCAVPLAESRSEIGGYAVTIRDVTASKHAELRALSEAETDALTGLPNRRALLRHLETRLDHAALRPFWFAIIDLDYFKAVNDTYGHDAGDLVLRQVAAVMRRMSAPGRFFARLGGDEFALIAEGLDRDQASGCCEELRSAIAMLDLAAFGGTPMPITASVGLTGIKEPCSASIALQAADAPLYAAKSVGGNRVETADPLHPMPNSGSDYRTEVA